jgi:hypothetical protein
MGVGLVLPTRNTATTISWTFLGTEDALSSVRPSGPTTTRRGGTQAPAGTGGVGDVGGADMSMARRMDGIVAKILLLFVLFVMVLDVL